MSLQLAISWKAVLTLLAVALIAGRASGKPADKLTVEQTQILRIQSASAARTIDVSKNAGKASVIHGNRMDFPHVAAYRNALMGDDSVAVVFSSAPIPLVRLQEAIEKDDEFEFDDLFDSEPPSYFQLTMGEGSTYYELYHDGNLISSSTKRISDSVDVNKLHLAGKVITTEVHFGGGIPLLFAAKFDAAIATPETITKEDVDGTATAASETVEIRLPNGIALNDPHQFYGYIIHATGTLRHEYSDVVLWCRRLAQQNGWTDRAPYARRIDDTIMLRYLDETAGPIDYVVTEQEDTTQLQVRMRRVVEARKDGVLPPAGMTRLLLVNLRGSAVELTLRDNKKYSLSAGQGASNFLDGAMTIVAADVWPITVTGATGSKVTGEVNCSGNDALIIMATNEGFRLGEIY